MEKEKILIFTLTINSFAIAVNRTIIDGLLVIQSRKDAKRGSDDLQTYSWISFSIGGMICFTLGGLIPVYFGNDGYIYVYLIPIFIGVGLIITGFFIKKDIDGDSRIVDMKLVKRLKFNLRLIENGLKLKQLSNTLYFFMIITFLTPNFGVFFDYYVNSGSVINESCDMVTSIGILASTIVYHNFL